MVNYREILRLHSLGTSQRSIAQQVQSSRDTVADIIKSAEATGISWPLGEDVTNEMIQELLFPGKYALACPYTQPDFPEIHNELAKKGNRQINHRIAFRSANVRKYKQKQSVRL